MARRLGIIFIFGFLNVVFSALSLAVDTTNKEHLEEITQALILLETGDADRAYEMLIKHEEAMAGWWEYDYLLGISLLDKGEANRAILALQRTVAMKPELVGARVDLGRAYYQVKEYSDALTEFEFVLARHPGNKTRDVVNGYVSTIKKTLNGNRSHFSPYLSVVGGFDSNANSATDNKEFLGFTLADENMRIPSVYTQLKAGMQQRYAFSVSNQMILSLNGSRRINKDAPAVNYSNYDTQIAWLASYSKIQQTFLAQVARTEIGESLINHSGSGMSATELHINKDLSYNMILSASRTLYSEAMSARNVDQFNVASGFLLKSNKAFQPDFLMSAVIGKSVGLQADSIYGRTLTGARLVMSKQLPLSLPVNASWTNGLMRSDFSSEFFDIKRLDYVLESSISLAMSVKKWSLSVQSAVMRNISNVGLYDFTRVYANTSITRRF